MNGRDLLHAMSGIDERYLAMADAPKKECVSMKKHRKPIYFLIAAVLISLLGVSAYAVTTKIQLNIRRYDQDTGETVPANAAFPYDTEVNFAPAAEEYVGLESCRPTWVPDGYRLRFVSAKAYGKQTLHYETDESPSALVFELTRGTEYTDMVLEDTVKEELVTVGTLPGTLYTAASGERVLLWADEEKGAGYILLAEDPDIDLLRVAQSVQPDPELKPTMEDHFQLALQELGDYQITGLPSNYPETEFMASPKEDGSDWYAYVNRWYIDVQKNDSVAFQYETFSLIGDKDEPQKPLTQEDVLQMYGSGDPTTVQGMQALVSDDSIAWIDWKNQVVFQISRDGQGADQLQRLADSVRRMN